MVAGNIHSMQLQPVHVPSETAPHLAWNLFAVLNDGWREHMPVSTAALQLINLYSHRAIIRKRSIQLLQMI